MSIEDKLLENINEKVDSNLLYYNLLCEDDKIRGNEFKFKNIYTVNNINSEDELYDIAEIIACDLISQENAYFCETWVNSFKLNDHSSYHCISASKNNQLSSMLNTMIGMSVHHSPMMPSGFICSNYKFKKFLDEDIVSPGLKLCFKSNNMFNFGTYYNIPLFSTLSCGEHEILCLPDKPGYYYNSGISLEFSKAPTNHLLSVSTTTILQFENLICGSYLITV